MSKQQFKSVLDQFAGQVVADLKAGISPLQKPLKDNGMPAFVLPVNPTTGKNYRGLNGLLLGMKGFDDPRWMTLNQARFAGHLVTAGSKGTLIDFKKKSDIQAIRTVDNQKVKDSEGKTQTKTVEFDKAVKATAFVFNALQVNEFPPLAEFLKEKEAGQTLSPHDLAEKIIRDSKAVIVHGGDEAFYDKIKDEIHLPDREQFENDTKYYHTAIHQLAHWTGHESRMNRPMEGKFGSMEYAKEELRASIAAMMLGSELKISHGFGQHEAYSNHWARLIKEEPYELFKASADAQRIFDAVTNIGQKQEVKEALTEKVKPGLLNKGDIIPYKNATYEVLAVLKGKTAQLLEQKTGNKFKVGPKDNLYTSLVEAKNNPDKDLDRDKAEEKAIRQEQSVEKDINKEYGEKRGSDLEPELSEASLTEENTAAYKMKR